MSINTMPTPAERAWHQDRENRMRPRVVKVMGQYTKGLLTAEELAAEVIQIGAADTLAQLQQAAQARREGAEQAIQARTADGRVVETTTYESHPCCAHCGNERCGASNHRSPCRRCQS